MNNPSSEPAQGLPTYLVLDVSKSMKPHEALLNRTLEDIVNTLYSSPRISEFVHLSILTFSTRPHVVLAMTEIARLTGLPTVECRGSTYFGPLFEALRDRIELDLPRLTAQGVRPLRPVVFLLTDGAPADDPQERWTEPFEALTDVTWRPHPHVITYGFGDAVEAVLKRMATVAAYIADPCAGTDTEAITAALHNMLNSLVATATAHALQIPERVSGYRTLPLEHVEF
ncbi:vWA domain-containing protein [Nonomuraea typhae]|uniref:vWA domain-containing protein n=1 Tax=Nonomuraea typhae TaxID=2603600 RepID=UPI0012F74EE6|nr:VWA domain-containing protein [Nonomuraea typhae]